MLYIRKLILISSLAIMLVGIPCCKAQVSDTWDERDGPAERTHLVVLFTEGATEDEIRAFSSMAMDGPTGTQFMCLLDRSKSPPQLKHHLVAPTVVLPSAT